MNEADVKAELEDVEQPKAEPSIAHEDEGMSASEGVDEKGPETDEREESTHRRADSPSNSTTNEVQRAVFVGNFPPAFCSEDIEELFAKHGEVARVDKKQNFAFVFMVNASDAESAIAELGGKAIGRPPRTLRVEWSRGDGAVRRREVARRSRSLPPNETLFVVNYDPEKVAQKDLEELFKVHGRIVRIELHGQFTFVQYETVEMATSALNSLNGQIFKNRSLIVEYTIRKDSTGRNTRYSSGRMSDVGSRGYGGRSSYGMSNAINGGYGSHGMYGGYSRGNFGGAPPYGMAAYPTVPGTGDYRGYDRNHRFSGRSSGSRRRDDDYGWQAAVSDRRSKRALSPRRSLSPRREGELPRKERKSHSRSLSRSRSPPRSRGRTRKDRSRSPSPKKRRTSKDNSLDRRGMSRSRSRSRSPSRRNRSDTRSASHSRSMDRALSPTRNEQDSPRAEASSFNHRRRSRSRSRSPTPDEQKHDAVLPSTVPAGP